MQMRAFRRILVVRTDRIGDVILTLPMLEVLRQHYPKAHVAMLVRRYTSELLEDNPYVDEVLLYDDGALPLPFSEMASLLRHKKFDVAFVTYPRVRLALLVWWAGIPLRIGTGYRWYSFLFNKRVYVHRKVALRHEVEYNTDLLAAVGCSAARTPFPHLNVPQSLVDSATRRLAELGMRPDERFVIIHPGSGGSAREWSPENFGFLGRRAVDSGDVRAVITGSKGEENIVGTVADIVGPKALRLVEELSLGEYAALAKRASLFIGNSTGTLHMAAAVGTPVIGLYPQVTAMSPTRWGPYTDRKTVFVPKNKPADCGICLRNKPPGSNCECMATITVDEVYDAARQYLNQEPLTATGAL